MRLFGGMVVAISSLILVADLSLSQTLSSADADQIPRLTAEVLQLESGEMDEDAIRRLIQIDAELGYPVGESVAPLQRQILMLLAGTNEAAAMEHIRHVFEAQPERRSSAAAALARATTERPDDLQDWRYMVRSLTVVDGDDALAVMTALRRFQQRATRGVWVRQVILIGLKLPEEQRATAEQLLQHWTSKPRAGRRVTPWSLNEYQSWFAEEFPNEPPAVLPVDAPDRRWTTATVTQALEQQSTVSVDIATGAAVYEKAGCQKCHRRGDIGQTFGPDLTSLGWRRTRQEIVQAILFPSHDLNEEYPSVTVVTKDGQTLSGLMSAGPEEMLVLVTPQAERHQIARADVEEIVMRTVSNMPEGTLEPLSETELQSLFAFLTSTAGVPQPHGDALP
ncbi:MAG: c-type cytochrome [Planctomycetaceae bacterium]|nr:c-type cytochrome [Planctomycetaceae bacterium]